jgi:hypothetical protein
VGVGGVEGELGCWGLSEEVSVFVCLRVHTVV